MGERDSGLLEIQNKMKDVYEERSLWRHYKGGLYVIEGVGILEKTEEPCIIYRNATEWNGILWVRSQEEWASKTADGEDRFFKVDDPPQSALYEFLILCKDRVCQLFESVIQRFRREGTKEK
jgi:hypothetical protein